MNKGGGERNGRGLHLDKLFNKSSFETMQAIDPYMTY